MSGSKGYEFMYRTTELEIANSSSKAMLVSVGRQQHSDTGERDSALSIGKQVERTCDMSQVGQHVSVRFGVSV